MMSFEGRLMEHTGGVLACLGLETIQVNLGLLCNQACAHCHVSASPGRSEVMGRETMGLVLDAAGAARPSLVDITGGAPELNPEFRWFVDKLAGAGHAVQVRTNLTALIEPGLDDLPEFLGARGVSLVGSLPCYLEQNVCAQRGPGVYEKSIEAMRRLNAVGYGVIPSRRLELVYNPGGAFLPPPQAKLELDYRRELASRFGVSFTSLLTITNMPIGRFWEEMKRQGRDGQYLELLTGSFNPDTLDGLMCRRQVSVGWDGRLFDCDFNLALGLPVEEGIPGHVRGFDPDRLSARRVVTGQHCFGCTAGCGSSCKGALV